MNEITITFPNQDAYIIEFTNGHKVVLLDQDIPKVVAHYRSVGHEVWSAKLISKMS